MDLRNHISALLSVCLIALLLPATVNAGSYTWITVDAPSGPVAYGYTQFTAVSPTSGTAIGYYFNQSSLYTVFAYNFSTRVLTPLAPTGLTSYFGINDNDLMAGTHDVRGLYATLSGGTITPPAGALAPAAVATDYGNSFEGINNSGLIVGFRIASSPNVQGVVFDVNTGKYLDISANAVTQSFSNQLLGDLQGININGMAVGQYQDASGYHSYTFNTLTNMPTLVGDAGPSTNSRLNGINDAGIAVGYWEDSNSVFHGIIYNTNTNSYLNTDFQDPMAGFAKNEGTVITGIDDKGDLVGYYLDSSGTEHGFVALVGAASVPEPRSVLLLAIGGLIAAFAARRRWCC